MPYAGMNAPLILCLSLQTAAEHAGAGLGENSGGAGRQALCAGYRAAAPVGSPEGKALWGGCRAAAPAQVSRG